MKYLIWAIIWPIQFLVTLFVFKPLSPVACLFVTRQPYRSTVKRLGKIEVVLLRDRLWRCFAWFDTFDNATDEFWYGMYDTESTKTQADYDASRVLRWWYRVRWLNRNTAYGLMHRCSIPKESWLAWQYKGEKPFLFGKLNNINIGWKAHKGFDTLMYAGRIVGLRNKVSAKG